MADLDTSNNQSNSGNNLQSDDNLSPWEVDLDVPEQNGTPADQPIEGTLYDQTASQQVTPEAVPLSIPDKPVSQIGQTLPANDFIPASVQPVTPEVSSGPPAEMIQPENKAQGFNDIVTPKASITATDQSPVAAMPQFSQLEPIPETPVASGVQTLPQVSSSPIADVLHHISGYRQVIFVIASFVVLVGGMIFLTETGNISIGAEKIYGGIGIEKLWGGLPKDTSAAFAQSFSKLSSEQTFKLNGTVAATINASKASPIFSPLIAEYGYKHLAQDIDLTRPQIRAVKAESTDDFDYILNGTADQSLDFLSNNTNSALENSNTEVADLSEDNNTNTGAFNSFYDDQENYPTYQTDKSETRDIYADLSGAFSPSGIETIFKVKKAVGAANINVKNSAGKFWVKSDGDIKFAPNADPEKYLEYSMDSLNGNSIQSVFFSPLMLNSLTVAGKRTGNEPMGGVRCYVYSISNLSLGNSLSNLGFNQENINTISGTLWIGVKDKLPRRISLKISGNGEAVVKNLDLGLDFYDYAVENNFFVPVENEIIIPAANINSNSDPSSNASTSTNDQKRKTDIQSIKTALTAYFDANGGYPVSNELLKLNIVGNAVQSALSPAYLSSWPADPKAADGWYYSYKSNGKTYTLSARLEDIADVEATTTNGIPLYIVTSIASAPTANSNNAQTADVKRKSDLAKIKTALLQYYAVNQEYPIANTILKLGQETILKNALVPTFISTLPTDSKSGWYYGYKSPDGQSFTLSAQLENVSDTEAKKVGNVYLYFLYNE